MSAYAHAPQVQAVSSYAERAFVRVSLHAGHLRLNLMCLLRAAGAMQVR